MRLAHIHGKKRRIQTGGSSVDPGFYDHHTGQRCLHAGQQYVRLCTEPAGAGLHPVVPAVRHLHRGVHGAPDHRAHLLRRYIRPVLPEAHHLHAGLYLRWHLCHGGTDPEPGMVQLSNTGCLVLYHRHHQQRLYGGL